jgi:hypothetical protein
LNTVIIFGSPAEQLPPPKLGNNNLNGNPRFGLGKVYAFILAYN